MAPELFDEVSPAPSPAVDMYAFGVLLWEMATRERPWKGVHPMMVPKLVAVEGKRPPLPGCSGISGRKLSPKFEALVCQCGRGQRAENRPTASAAYNALKQAGTVFAEDGEAATAVAVHS